MIDLNKISKKRNNINKAKIKNSFKNGYSYLICIAGASGSGKTTVTRNLLKLLDKANHKDFVIISIDNYYRSFKYIPMNERKNINFDDPLSIDYELLTKNIFDLLKGKTIEEPIYDFTIHDRVENKVKITKPASIIILEGIFALYFEDICAQKDLGLFVDTDSDLCFIRRLQRDINERKRTMNSVIDQYIRYTKPMFEKYILASKKNADLVIPEGGQNYNAINALFNSLLTILNL